MNYRVKCDHEYEYLEMAIKKLRRRNLLLW